MTTTPNLRRRCAWCSIRDWPPSPAAASARATRPRCTCTPPTPSRRANSAASASRCRRPAMPWIWQRCCGSSPTAASTRCRWRRARRWPAPSCARAWSTRCCCTWRRFCWARRRGRCSPACRSRTWRSEWRCGSSTTSAWAMTCGCGWSPGARWSTPARRAEESAVFTGIIEAVGSLAAREARGGDARLRIAVGALPFADAKLGESVAVNGVCLTVVAFDAGHFEADASNETLALTTLGGLGEGAPLNLERAMRPTDRLGGHLVSGHVDGVGRVLEVREDARAQRWRFAMPQALAKYVAQKGSICVDGVSLTVNTAG